jgi:hypothetical protein
MDPPSIVVPTEVDVDVLMRTPNVEDGQGVYPGALVRVPHILEREGATVDCQYPPTWAAKRSLLGVAALELFVAGGAHAGWDALASVPRRAKADTQLRVVVERRTDTSAGSTWEWVKVEGEPRC